jgi:hypothetical protein
MPCGVAKQLKCPLEYLHDFPHRDSVPTHLPFIIFVEGEDVDVDGHLAVLVPAMYTEYTEYTMCEEIIDDVARERKQAERGLPDSSRPC